MSGGYRLHGFYRSTASYRVRIALNLKGIAYETVPHHLRHGEQRLPEFLAINPQGFVPALETPADGVLTQSLAICEYLDDVVPEPALLPSDPADRARVRAFAQVICCDIHPVQNLKVLLMLRNLGHDEATRNAWAARVIEDGLGACNTLLERSPGPYCFGDQVTLADLTLVPQLTNARRFGAALRWPRLLDIEAACLDLPAFQAARPEAQADAE